MKACASLHNRKRSSPSFLWMQAGGLLLHKLSLYKALCRLPNSSELHPVSLDRSYAAFQTPPYKTSPRMIT
jgi:hypothetical protein